MDQELKELNAKLAILYGVPEYTNIFIKNKFGIPLAICDNIHELFVLAAEHEVRLTFKQDSVYAQSVKPQNWMSHVREFYSNHTCCKRAVTIAISRVLILIKENENGN